ncbi:chromatin assembly factor 1 subunit B [Cimex lectularius]|uniref:CAF1B/HIR1 beta-propeller domain-containing protein n=1 Tax=Cimex lectularius TaxID=79782 RepID=A0A8I6RWM1_CIMLE|nr:chromatin assembly factor 1 subunit B [Cimex lectularius]
MKCTIPEISWHNRDPVLSVDVQVKKPDEPFYRLASGGSDTHVLIWRIIRQDTGVLQLDCVCDLTKHQKAVNVVKFSPSGEFLASGDDESYIIIWKQRSKEDAPDLDKEVEMNDEHWIQFKILRGHLNDVYDLCWSPDSIHLLSGSVDNTAIIWHVTKGHKVSILSEGNNFIQGVTWDPKNKFAATLSSDSKCRIYDWRSHKMVFNIGRGRIPGHLPSPGEEDKKLKLFHDDTLKTFFRRLEFSPDGQLLSTPTGTIEPPVNTSEKLLNVTWIFARKQFNTPVLYYPSNQPSMITRWCPIKFQLRPETKPVILLPYRMILAVASKSAIVLYDTQYAVPIGLISNIHYTKLTDMAWSSDGRILVASSTDGYCSLITFTENELGDCYIEAETSS